MLRYFLLAGLIQPVLLLQAAEKVASKTSDEPGVCSKNDAHMLLTLLRELHAGRWSYDKQEVEALSGSLDKVRHMLARAWKARQVQLSPKSSAPPVAYEQYDAKSRCELAHRCAWSPDGSYCAFICHDGKIRVFNGDLTSHVYDLPGQQFQWISKKNLMVKRVHPQRGRDFIVYNMQSGTAIWNNTTYREVTYDPQHDRILAWKDDYSPTQGLMVAVYDPNTLQFEKGIYRNARPGCLYVKFGGGAFYLKPNYTPNTGRGYEDLYSAIVVPWDLAMPRERLSDGRPYLAFAETSQDGSKGFVHVVYGNHQSSCPYTNGAWRGGNAEIINNMFEKREKILEALSRIPQVDFPMASSQSRILELQKFVKSHKVWLSPHGKYVLGISHKSYHYAASLMPDDLRVFRPGVVAASPRPKLALFRCDSMHNAADILDCEMASVEANVWWSPDESIALLCHADGALTYIDVVKKVCRPFRFGGLFGDKPLQESQTAHASSVQDLVINNKGDKCLSLDEHGKVIVWSLPAMRCVYALISPLPFKHATWSDDDAYIETIFESDNKKMRWSSSSGVCQGSPQNVGLVEQKTPDVSQACVFHRVNVNNYDFESLPTPGEYYELTSNEEKSKCFFWLCCGGASYGIKLEGHSDFFWFSLVGDGSIVIVRSVSGKLLFELYDQTAKGQIALQWLDEESYAEPHKEHTPGPHDESSAGPHKDVSVDSSVETAPVLYTSRNKNYALLRLHSKNAADSDTWYLLNLLNGDLITRFIKQSRVCACAVADDGRSCLFGLEGGMVRSLAYVMKSTSKEASSGKEKASRDALKDVTSELRLLLYRRLGIRKDNVKQVQAVNEALVSHLRKYATQSGHAAKEHHETGKEEPALNNPISGSFEGKDSLGAYLCNNMSNSAHHGKNSGENRHKEEILKEKESQCSDGDDSLGSYLSNRKAPGAPLAKEMAERNNEEPELQKKESKSTDNDSSTGAYRGYNSAKNVNGTKESVETGNEEPNVTMQEPKSPEARLLYLEISPDKNFAVQLFDTGNARVVTSEDGCELHKLAGHTGDITKLVWSMSGNLLAGICDETVVIWNAADGTCRVTCVGHEADVVGIVWSSDDDYVLSRASYDVKIWSKNGRCMYTFADPTTRVMSAQFTGGSEKIMIEYADKSTKIFDAKKGDLIASM